jgi:hypothetical protein
MKVKKWTATVIFLVTLAGYASTANATSALSMAGAAITTNSFANYNLGWEFTPKENIVVTKLGYCMPPGVIALNWDHVITIYDGAGSAVVSGTIMGEVNGGEPVTPEADGYAYVDAAPEGVQLNQGQTYVIASHWTRWAPNWWDLDVQNASGYAYASDFITPGRLGLYDYSTSPSKPGTDGGSSYRFLSANFQFEPASTVVTVQIDIKPGVYPNPINQGANGVIPVAILTTPEFDAAAVDAGTVVLNGATVAVRGQSNKLLARMEDVDGDGDADLICQVDTESWGELYEDGYVTLSGQTTGGVAIEGQDYVIIVPPQP